MNAARVVASDGAGRPVLISGIAQDITRRLEVEELGRRDAGLLDIAKQSIVCTDLQGRVVYWSRGAHELYGWTAAEMMGRHFWERMPTEEMRAHARLRMHTAATQGEFRHEREDFRKDGTRIYVESRVFALRDGAGKVVGVIGTAHDITARRQAELERIQLERQLLQAQKMETVGTLAGGMAHEFNNILTAIIGNTELALLTDPDNAVHRKYHESVLRSSRRARDLVQRVLAFSRCEEPKRIPVRLGHVVSEAAELIRATLPSTIELGFDADSPAPEILADPSQIQQVLMNLAANAAYAMRERGGRLSLRLRTVAFTAPHPCTLVTLSPGTYAALEVADTGQGIQAKTLAKIFDPFFTTKPIGEGSGLGLAIVHGIATGHRGGVEVSSSPGGGAAFTVYFPVPEACPAPAAPVADPAQPRPIEPGSGEQIVVIDDEEDVAAVVDAALRHLGYRVRRFAAADDFYKEFSVNPFRVDLVLTDQTMPRLTGTQLAHRLRAEGHAFPMAIVSGQCQEPDPSADGRLERVAFLRKPFDLTRLASTLRDLLGHPPA